MVYSLVSHLYSQCPREEKILIGGCTGVALSIVFGSMMILRGGNTPWQKIGMVQLSLVVAGITVLGDFLYGQRVNPTAHLSEPIREWERWRLVRTVGCLGALFIGVFGSCSLYFVYQSGGKLSFWSKIGVAASVTFCLDAAVFSDYKIQRIEQHLKEDQEQFVTQKPVKRPRDYVPYVACVLACVVGTLWCFGVYRYRLWNQAHLQAVSLVAVAVGTLFLTYYGGWVLGNRVLSCKEGIESRIHDRNYNRYQAQQDQIENAQYSVLQGMRFSRGSNDMVFSCEGSPPDVSGFDQVCSWSVKPASEPNEGAPDDQPSLPANKDLPNEVNRICKERGFISIQDATCDTVPRIKREGKLFVLYAKKITQ